MMPKGGNVIWGGGDTGHPAPDVLDEEMGRMASSILRFSDGRNMTVEEAAQYLLTQSINSTYDDGNLIRYAEEW